MYTRKGLRLANFKSKLPGGSPMTNKNNLTILDCIWIQDKEILYILDLIVWSGQNMVQCEVSFVKKYFIKST